jgi:hypothetical protein
MRFLIRPGEERDVVAMEEIRARLWGTRDFWIDRIGRAARGFYAKHGAASLNEHWMIWEESESMSKS